MQENARMSAFICHKCVNDKSFAGRMPADYQWITFVRCQTECTTQVMWSNTGKFYAKIP